MSYTFSEFKNNSGNRNLSETLEIVLRYEIITEKRRFNNTLHTTSIKLLPNINFINGKYMFKGLNIITENYDEVPDMHNYNSLIKQNYKKTSYGVEKNYNTILVFLNSQDKLESKHITLVQSSSDLNEFYQKVYVEDYAIDYYEIFYLMDRYKKRLRKYYKMAYESNNLKEFECFYKGIIDSYNESLDRNKEQLKVYGDDIFWNERFTVCFDKECDAKIVKNMNLFELKIKYFTSTRYGKLEKSILSIKEIEKNIYLKYIYFSDVMLELSRKRDYTQYFKIICKMYTDEIINADTLKLVKNLEKKKIEVGLDDEEETLFSETNKLISEKVNKHLSNLDDYIREEEVLKLGSLYVGNLIERKQNGARFIIGPEALGEPERVLQSNEYQLESFGTATLDEIRKTLHPFLRYQYQENEVPTLAIMEKIISKGGEPISFIDSALIEPKPDEMCDVLIEKKVPMYAHVLSVLLCLGGFTSFAFIGLLIGIISSHFIKKSYLSGKIKHPFIVSTGIFIITDFLFVILNIIR